MIQSSASQTGNKQLADNTIPPLDENVPEVELTEFQRCINVLCLEPTKTSSSRVTATGAVVIGIAIALLALPGSAESARNFKWATPLGAIQKTGQR